MASSDISAARRNFLRLLAATPLASAVGVPAVLEALQQAKPLAKKKAAAPAAALAPKDNLITAASEAVDVMDFEAVARKNLLPAHWAYMATGVDDDATIKANHEGFSRYQLRMRPLVDFSRLDMSIQLLGRKWSTPIVLCPVASQKGFHTEGEKGTAKAARAKGHLMCLSNQTSTSVEDVNAARGEPVWFQLYARPDFASTTQIVKRAEAAGCPVLVWTVDLLGGSNRETLRRGEGPLSVRAPFCKECHEGRVQPMAQGLASVGNLERGAGPTVFTWDYIKRLRDVTNMKLFVKGIQTGEDAELGVKAGLDGLWVSNHGGRAGESLRPTIDSLPEVAAAVSGKIPIICDSGVRHGTDIFKALALGATAVGVGRPQVWSLAAFGQEGVEAMLDILRRELMMTMRQAGATSIDKITRASLIDRLRIG
ncbi:MAG: alpha-hydroxy-acid oxidizing protein [Acidobacteriia bacterium]|nr:alpha-hydroxy-acid oxidizing protein [Terriglobia bacterium]